MERSESTGVTGLDDILGGGLPAERLYVVEGDPGAGKTTLSLQFLLQGVAHGERALYVTLSESRAEIIAIAASHGWSLDKLDILELSAAENPLEEENTLFHPAEVELGQRVQEIFRAVASIKPRRMVVDSCSELRLLAQGSLRFRRQILSLKRHLAGQGCTVLLIDNPTEDEGDILLQSLAHGVVHLEQLAPLFGAERRRLRVSKLRGRSFRGGYHDLIIRKGGLVIYPRLIASEHGGDGPSLESASTGIDGLDSLLGGGLDRGTATLVLGPPGSGKSSLALQCAFAAAQRGERSLVYLFEDAPEIAMHRSKGLGMDLAPLIESGDLVVRQIDPAELAPGEFAQSIRENVEKENARLVIIDSLNGYLHAMPDERFLTLHLHELLTYLRHRRVLSILVEAQHGVIGQSMQSPVDVSYLADTMLLFRYFEARGTVRKALSILKKRTGLHENTIREFTLTASGLTVGRPLTGFHGVLTGVPVFSGDDGALEGDA